MAFLVNRPQTSDPVNYVTVGMNKSLLLVGLGNIGAEYDGTRHNIGFAIIDAFAAASSFGPWTNKKDLKCHLVTQQLGETRVILIKPTTMMNLSGEAVQAVIQFYKVSPGSIIVVHDELDVNFGQIRSRIGGSSAGHNGIKSISKSVSEDYARLRFGIGPKQPEQIDSADFVLQKFSKDEQADMSAGIREATAWLSEYAFGSPITAETRSFI
ncbi:MAG: aminoacyl-tRNA hydrolase [Candidatus Saccharimonadales bacterium]